ncbi:MAG: endonuclease/exonuclease/phosphatase family protein [Gammaproteobacteria bacterium]|nr:endonuclease/exonuclease/phosphatase family protein [Gammaproteobacteria bacterium]
MDIKKIPSQILLVLFFICSTTVSYADNYHTDNRRGKIKVMTQNLYVGADLMHVVTAGSPEQVPVAVAQTLAMIKQTNFIERAESIADQIKEEKPDLIGLQEVSLIRLQSPSDYFIGNPQNAQDVLYDYLDILLAALERRDLHYTIVSTVNNADVEVPAVTGLDANGAPQFIDVRLSDRDVILARKGIKTSNPASANYQVNLLLPIAGGTIPFTRGYTAVDAKVQGITYRVVNTHLEVKGEGIVTAVQAMQAQELIGLLENETHPVVLLGDFNSSPADPIDPVSGIVPPYKQLGWAGYLDAWLQIDGGDEADKPGYTCCQAEDLKNALSQMNERIDYIFYRSDTTALAHKTDITMDILGEEVKDKSPSGLWPSDHAGLYAELKFAVQKHKGKVHNKD